MQSTTGHSKGTAHEAPVYIGPYRNLRKPISWLWQLSGGRHSHDAGRTEVSNLSLHCSGKGTANIKFVVNSAYAGGGFRPSSRPRRCGSTR
ncbi:protein of unknown function [Burkholderia multivorans]